MVSVRYKMLTSVQKKFMNTTKDLVYPSPNSKIYHNTLKLNSSSSINVHRTFLIYDITNTVHPYYINTREK